MVDISKLIAQIEAAAKRAKAATEDYASGRMSVDVCASECDEFNRLTDSPEQILAVLAYVRELERWRDIDSQIKFSLCYESESLHDQLHVATRHIAEMAMLIKRLRHSIPKTPRLIMHMTIF